MSLYRSFNPIVNAILYDVNVYDISHQLPIYMKKLFDCFISFYNDDSNLQLFKNNHYYKSAFIQLFFSWCHFYGDGKTLRILKKIGNVES